MLTKIISGGQTGVDRAALDVAIELGIPHGGWCPKGRKAEDGPLPATYLLTESPKEDYTDRTRKNVQSSDGTLILKQGMLKGGTAFTAALCHDLKKPLLIFNVDDGIDRHAFEKWLAKNKIAVLNVAGPRESQSPGIYETTKKRLRLLLV